MKSNKTQRTCSQGHIFYKSSDCLVCPLCEEERKPQDNFLSKIVAPARRALESKGITTPEQLKDYSEMEILNLHGMGKGTIVKLRTILSGHGYQFKK